MSGDDPQRHCGERLVPFSLGLQGAGEWAIVSEPVQAMLTYVESSRESSPQTVTTRFDRRREAATDNRLLIYFHPLGTASVSTELALEVCAWSALPQQGVARKDPDAAVLQLSLNSRPRPRTRSQGRLYPTVLAHHAEPQLPRSQHQFLRRMVRESSPAGNPARRSLLAVDSGNLLPDWILSLRADNWPHALSAQSGVGRFGLPPTQRHKAPLLVRLGGLPMNTLGGSCQQMCQPHVWLNRENKTVWSGQGRGAETE
jgi:hypothetical protein